MSGSSDTNTDAQSQDVLRKITELYEELFRHDGFGEMSLEMRLLRRGQKEVIIHCGKQYRFVVNYNPSS